MPTEDCNCKCTGIQHVPAYFLLREAKEVHEGPTEVSGYLLGSGHSAVIMVVLAGPELCWLGGRGG